MGQLLVIEDDEVMGSLVAQMLTKAGHTVRVATTGSEGLKTLGTYQADLVVTDLYMPDTDGVEVIKQLRKLRPNLPIIAVSGGGGMNGIEILRIAQFLGANEVLAKPIRSDQLISAVSRCLGSKT